MYLVIISFKENILDCIHDINIITSEYPDALKKQNGNVRIHDYNVTMDGVHIIMSITNNIHSPTSYVAKNDEKIISDFVRQYKLTISQHLAKDNLWHPRYSVKAIDKPGTNKR